MLWLCTITDRCNDVMDADVVSKVYICVYKMNMHHSEDIIMKLPIYIYCTLEL